MKKYTSFEQYQTGFRVALLSVLLICQGARADPVPITSDNFTQILHKPSGNYQLVQDIFWPQAWEPWNFPPFSGVFNGDNHVVHNATLFVEPDQGTGQGGFFQETDGAVIKNIAFYRLQVSGYNLSGLLSGSARDSVFTNIRCIDCTVTGQPGEDAALLFGSSVNNSVSGVEIDGSAIALPGLAGMDGVAGSDGSNGTAFSAPAEATIVPSLPYCKNGVHGRKGNPGTKGINGSPSNDGKAGGSVASLAVHSRNSQYNNIVAHPENITAGQGGAGGKGGKGGKGGEGGTGQKGGDLIIQHKCLIFRYAGNVGHGGNAGNGGNGGKGGKGGHGGSCGVLIKEGLNNTIEGLLTHLRFLPGSAGNPGSGGLYGNAGAAGAAGTGGNGTCDNDPASNCGNGLSGAPGVVGIKGASGAPGAPGQPGTIIFPPAENSVSNVFINSDLNTPLVNSTLPGLKSTDELHNPDTYTDLDKSRWRVAAGLSPYPVQLDELYLATAGLDNRLDLFAYPGCWFLFGKLEGTPDTLLLQGERVHGLFSVPERLGSSYWMMFGQNGDRLPLNSHCGSEQFDRLNPGGALVDAFIPVADRQSLILWRIPGTDVVRLAFASFSGGQSVQFAPFDTTLDETVLDQQSSAGAFSN